MKRGLSRISQRRHFPAIAKQTNKIISAKCPAVTVKSLLSIAVGSIWSVKTAAIAFDKPIYWKKQKARAEPDRPSGVQHCACHTDGHELEPWPEPPPMAVDISVSPYIKKAWLPYWPQNRWQVLYQSWIWGSHRCKRMQKVIHPGFESQTSPEVQNRDTSGSIAHGGRLLASDQVLKPKC